MTSNGELAIDTIFSEVRWDN